MPSAIAYIKGGNEALQLSGEIKFYQKKDHVLIVANVSGLPQSDTGFFGFHIHEGNSCSGEDFADTKSHYNPANAPHPHHAGDLPPLMYSNGGAYFAVTTDRFSVMDILGRTVVIHNMPDDFTSQPAGNAGTKIGCGVIQRINKKIP
ncbi:MAG: superoxide dismutase family protein [Clostridia bacterium]|nr:superoxide dismutase family protein [Clostridia bacterium]